MSDGIVKKYPSRVSYSRDSGAGIALKNRKEEGTTPLILFAVANRFMELRAKRARSPLSSFSFIFFSLFFFYAKRALSAPSVLLPRLVLDRTSTRQLIPRTFAGGGARGKEGKNNGQGGDTFGAVCTEASRSRTRSEKGRRRRTAERDVETGEERAEKQRGPEGREDEASEAEEGPERVKEEKAGGGWRVAVAAAAASMEGSESRTRRRRGARRGVGISNEINSESLSSRTLPPRLPG